MIAKIIKTRLIWRYALYNWLLLKYRKVEYETYPRISGKLFITGSGALKLGKNVRFNSCRSANPIGGDDRVVLSIAQNTCMQIGDNTGISNSAIICGDHINIGSNVHIGGGVKIYDSNFHSLKADHRAKKGNDIPLTAAVIIGNGCFIGAHSIILKGVEIGSNSIIGAGSVVSKSIPKNEIWGGNPAKMIKKID